ncbi:MAG: asparagine synthase (glutamine-hydrolyzing) [Proteobacteria bacterium]|nr:asparagine synthase (glutamine-hydrolyzing) [Pseudomonadota bacterium]HQR04143.1 asparagine synthase (glutamine-hydrolyzing) [Rhodocyclaceae bacterium]
MCGIAGFFGRHTRSATTADAMLSALLKRGPDARHAVFWDAALKRSAGAGAHALLHARLSIIDTRPEADQPMSNADGSVWICYNGEVYGWADEARALARQGTDFRTRCDTEFILRGYEAWGMEALLPRLRGMFAFAILDLRRRKVLLARDRMGEKPLVYAHRQGELAFGSLVRAVLPWLPRAERVFDAEAIDAYLAHRYIPAPRTVFQGVQRLENGHWLEYDLDSGELVKHCYWQARPLPAPDWMASLDEAVALRTVADRPLGLFLSSGVDSSLIACRLAALNHPVQTFSAGFPGSPMDESADAARIAARLGHPHRIVAVAPAIAGDFATVVADLDEPFADPSAFPTWALSRETAREVKVVLGGDGGDELFAGYKRHAQHLRGRGRGSLRLPLPTLPDAEKRGWRKTLSELSMSWTDAYNLRFSGFTPNQRRLLQPGMNQARPHYWRMPEMTDADAAPLHTLLAIDMANFLPEYVFRKIDLCTMAHGLEARAPLVDHVWYQHLLALPDAQRFTRPPKSMLRPALAPLQDEDVLGRKKKGFNPPVADWLRADLAAHLPGLGARLEALTAGRIAGAAAEAFVDRFTIRGEGAEQVLQLLVLAESLRQLAQLSAELN